jgi:hypothetical protein
MTYCLYVDNELEEEGLELEDALSLEEDILDEDPYVEVRVAPEIENDEDEDLEEWGEEEEEE